MDPVELVFFGFLSLIVYVYFGYPFALLLLSSVRKREWRYSPDARPSVTIVIAAYNEEETIEAKLDNCLTLNYPPDKLGVLVVSDGSTDKTMEKASNFAGARVRVMDLPRIGKVQAINEAVKCCSTDFIVFTDANALFESQAIQSLMGYFVDPMIGCVCGNQRHEPVRDGDSSGSGEGLYWRYDKWIKQLETKIGGTVAADGSIYSIRRELYSPIIETAQADDFAVSLRIATQGFRVIFDENAVSYEPVPTSSSSEFNRKIRIANQSMRSLVDHAEALNPFRNKWYAVKLLSHKLLRYLVPVFMILVFLANLWLAPGSYFYSFFLAGQILFFVFAALGYAFRDRPIGRNRLLYVPFYFCLANLAVLAALVAVTSRRRITAWEHQRGEE